MRGTNDADADGRTGREAGPVPPLLLLAAVLAFAIAFLAIAFLANSATASPDRSPMYSFCDGQITEIPEVRPCPDGSLRIVG